MTDSMEIKFVGELERLVFQPGDTLVVRVDRPLPLEVCLRIQSYVEKRLPGTNVLVLDGGMKIEVVAGLEVTDGAH